jgi:spore germination protein KB
MIERQNISQRQAFYIFIAPIYSLLIFLHPNIISIAGRGAWAAEIIGFLSLLPLVLWTLWLGQTAPGHTIMEILEMTAGKIIGRTAGLIYTLIITIIAALSIRNLCGMLQIFILPDTPIWVTSLVILGISIIIAQGGIEVQGRMAETLVIVANLTFFLGVSLAFVGQFNLDFIIPFFDRSIGELAKGSFLTAGLESGSNLCLLAVVAALPRPLDNFRAITKVYFVGGLILSSVTLIIIGIFGVDEAARLALSGLSVAWSAQLGNFIQGTEVFVVVGFIEIQILAVGVYAYCGWVETTRTFNYWCPRLWITLIASLTAVLAISINSLNDSYFLSTLVGPYLVLPFTFLLLLITSICLLIRGRKVAVRNT